MAKNRNQKHIVLFPFMAHGHLTPFLALARTLEQIENYNITIVSTPLNIQKLKSSLPRESKIHLAEIPLNGTKFGLPKDTENSEYMSADQFVSLFEASKSLQQPFKNFIVEISRRDDVASVFIIADMMLGWTVTVARELGIFHSVFIAGAGYSMGLYFSISINKLLWKIEGEELDFTVPDFPEAGKIEKACLSIDLKYVNDLDMIFQFRRDQFSLCLSSDAILLNTMVGLDFQGERYFQRKTGGKGKSVFSIGPLLLSSTIKNDDLRNGFSYSKWLDLHQPHSVLYVSFGSQGRISLEQMMELAMGLEASGKAFIWVVRPPVEFSVRETFRDEWLPEGFKERVKRENRGVLVHEWAPQLEILSHESIGGFISHCGWNSVLESLSKGVPIIAWPLMAEQIFNSQMLDKEIGVCVEVGRGKESEIVKRNEICDIINIVMGKTEKGEEMRRTANELRKKMADAVVEREGYRGSSFKALDEFLKLSNLQNQKHS